MVSILAQTAEKPPLNLTDIFDYSETKELVSKGQLNLICPTTGLPNPVEPGFWKVYEELVTGAVPFVLSIWKISGKKFSYFRLLGP